MTPKGVRLGDVLSNESLRKKFAVGNMGGMRRSYKTNSLVIISDSTKGLYKDRWEGDVLHYTGMGKVGDQTLSGNQNKTLEESETNGVDVHLFEVFTRHKYVYQGKVSLIGKPYQEIQKDDNGANRKVWMFPIKLLDVSQRYLPSEAEVRRTEEESEKEARQLSTDELKKRAEVNTNKAHSVEVTQTRYVRNPFVVEYVRRRADGKCELCGSDAPFLRKDKQPFLEGHHVVWLSRGGDDTIQNTVALCPNCHRKVHHLESRHDIDKLKCVTS